MALPDHQMVEIGPCGLALSTRCAGGAVIDFPCGFRTFRPAGDRCARWQPVDVEEFISTRLDEKAPL